LRCCDGVRSSLLYNRNSKPFGQSWEKWAALWYMWMISIPKNENPCLDETGKCCSVNQKNKDVWFLAGSFGNTVPVRRKCTIPSGRAILLPVLVKEDSFAEDHDLKTEEELRKRAKEATDKVLHMEASIDGLTVLYVKASINGMKETLAHLKGYRVQSEVINLEFPRDNVYDIPPGVTRSISDGFWLFLKPLEMGKYNIYFKGETLLADPFTRDKMRKTEVYASNLPHIDRNLFRVEVSYELTVGSKKR
jgi:hypothetical protein